MLALFGGLDLGPSIIIIFVLSMIYLWGFYLTWEMISSFHGHPLSWFVRFLPLLSFAGIIIDSLGWLFYGIVWVLRKLIWEGEHVDTI